MVLTYHFRYVWYVILIKTLMLFYWPISDLFSFLYASFIDEYNHARSQPNARSARCCPQINTFKSDETWKAYYNIKECRLTGLILVVGRSVIECRIKGIIRINRNAWQDKFTAGSLLGWGCRLDVRCCFVLTAFILLSALWILFGFSYLTCFFTNNLWTYF